MTFSKEVVHAGPLGAGMALKLARNAVGYAWMHAVDEAAERAHRSGVDVALLEQAVLEAGTFERAFTPIGLGGPSPFPPGAPSAKASTVPCASSCLVDRARHAGHDRPNEPRGGSRCTHRSSTPTPMSGWRSPETRTARTGSTTTCRSSGGTVTPARSTCSSG